ncbi:MAG TPA: hypothetical protein VFF04_00180 [Candidatus Babeliales bacterium]|nr:hypothetical protein [Candidatus Babeliales bacterium]
MINNKLSAKNCSIFLVFSCISFNAQAMNSSGLIKKHTSVGFMSLHELCLAAQANLAVLKFSQATTLQEKSDAKAELAKLTALYGAASKPIVENPNGKDKNNPKKEAKG